jgi:hypothetical protein
MCDDSTTCIALPRSTMESMPPLLGDGKGRYKVHLTGNSGKLVWLRDWVPADCANRDWQGSSVPSTFVA